MISSTTIAATGAALALCLTGCGSHAQPVSTTSEPVLTLAQACTQTAIPKDLSTRAKVSAYQQLVADLSTHADPAATQYLSHLEAVIQQAQSIKNFGEAGLRFDMTVPAAREACGNS